MMIHQHASIKGQKSRVEQQISISLKKNQSAMDGVRVYTNACINTELLAISSTRLQWSRIALRAERVIGDWKDGGDAGRAAEGWQTAGRMS